MVGHIDEGKMAFRDEDFKDFPAGHSEFREAVVGYFHRLMIAEVLHLDLFFRHQHNWPVRYRVGADRRNDKSFKVGR